MGNDTVSVPGSVSAVQPAAQASVEEPAGAPPSDEHGKEDGDAATAPSDGDEIKTLKGIPRTVLLSESINEPHVLPDIKIGVTRVVEVLTQERLEQLWKQLADKHRDNAALLSLIEDKRVELIDNNTFAVWVPNIVLENDLRKYQDLILSFLREQTGNEVLQYRVQVKMQKREIKPFSAQEKYDYMLKRNPDMAKLRKLFPDIDM